MVAENYGSGWTSVACVQMPPSVKKKLFFRGGGTCIHARTFGKKIR